MNHVKYLKILQYMDDDFGTFPFGMAVKRVKQIDRSPKKYLYLV